VECQGEISVDNCYCSTILAGRANLGIKKATITMARNRLHAVPHAERELHRSGWIYWMYLHRFIYCCGPGFPAEGCACGM